MDKVVRICIIDSGVDLSHPAIDRNRIKGFSIFPSEDGELIIQNDRYDDSVGHGTAVTSIIQSVAHDSDITMIKLLEDDLTVDPELLNKTLEYIAENNNYDIINLSLGTIDCPDITWLEHLCQTIANQGTIIISAFDAGAVSFPAYFDCVVGVDSSPNCKKTNQWEFLDDSIVNIRGIGTLQRVAWKNPRYVLTNGNSFTCACITGHAALLISKYNCNSQKELLKLFKEKAIVALSGSKGEKDCYHFDPSCLGKVALFPINKETHSLLRFPDLLPFRIVEAYDTKYSGNVGNRVGRLLSCELQDDMVVKNLSELKFENLDGLIVGHTNQISSIVQINDLIKDRIYHAVRENKKIFLFDKPDDPLLLDNPNVFYPRDDYVSLIDKAINKLYYIPQPVIGVAGTSSKQGKFTFQLELKRRLQRDGYRVGALGTEPHSALFGFNEVFHCGYNSKLEMSISDTVKAVNHLMWNISKGKPDIIIVGFQSGLTPKNIYDLSSYPLVHHLVLHGARPDALFLCFNSDDEIDTIESNIKIAEGISEGKVIGLVCFPKILKKRWEKDNDHYTDVTENQITQMKKKLKEKFVLPVFVIGNETDMEDAYTSCIDYFSEEEK